MSNNISSDNSVVPPQQGLSIENCAICMSIFRYPKLLECRHTFCAACLNKLHSSSRDKSKIQCPVCRHNSTLQNGWSIENLPTNFFVSTLENEYLCDKCDLSSKEPLLECGQCASNLCKSCYANHVIAVYTTNGTNEIMGRNNDIDDYDNDEIYPDDPVLRGTIRCLCQTSLNSFYCGRISNKFRLKGATNITKIVPVSANTAWVLPDQTPEVFKFNRNGQIEERRPIGKGNTLDICVNGAGDLLAICEGISVVFKCTRTGPKVFIETVNYLPVCLSSHKNDGLLIGAVEQGLRVENFVLIYDHKQQLTDVKGIGKRLAFRQIVSLAYNSVTNQIAVADSERNMVYLLGENMKIQTYRSRTNFPTRRRSPEVNQTSVFTPTSVCYDHDGTIFVFDRSSSFIHVLNSNGKLIGMLIGNDGIQAGDPSCICFSSDKKFWIGDMLTGQIRVYTVDQVYNKIHSGLRGSLSLRDRSETLREQMREREDRRSLGSSGQRNLVLLRSETTRNERREVLSSTGMCDLSVGSDAVQMTIGAGGLEIRSTLEPNNPRRNSHIRMYLLHHVLNCSNLQSYFRNQEIPLEDVVRACTTETV